MLNLEYYYGVQTKIIWLTSKSKGLDSKKIEIKMSKSKGLDSKKIEIKMSKSKGLDSKKIEIKIIGSRPNLKVWTPKSNKYLRGF
jgi:hypothetical protein